jgi:hypothetical protein
MRQFNSSWNDGAAKRAITDFVARVTTKDGPDFVPPVERIAVFDNDGTLWAEQPMYFQLAFILDRLKTLAPQHPEWKGSAAVQGGTRRRHEDHRGIRPARAVGIGDGDSFRHDHR